MEYENDPGWQYLRRSRDQILEVSYIIIFIFFFLKFLFLFFFFLYIFFIYQDQNRPYDSKKNCWVPDAEEGYIAAEITATKGDNVTIVTARGNEVSLYYNIKIFFKTNVFFSKH